MNIPKEAAVDEVMAALRKALAGYDATPNTLSARTAWADEVIGSARALTAAQQQGQAVASDRLLGSPVYPDARTDPFNALLTKPQPMQQGGGELPSPLNGDFDCPKAAAARSCPCGFCSALRTPSAPVGVEGLRRYELRLTSTCDGGEMRPEPNGGWVAYHDVLRLAQQPASDGGFTAADMMDARQEGRKEGQQPAAVDRRHPYVQSKYHSGCANCGYPEWEPWHALTTHHQEPKS